VQVCEAVCEAEAWSGRTSAAAGFWRGAGDGGGGLLFLGGAVDAGVGGDVAGDVGVLPGPSVGSVLVDRR
jgi:hypothetical protein